MAFVLPSKAASIPAYEQAGLEIDFASFLEAEFSDAQAQPSLASTTQWPQPSLRHRLPKLP
eukprot:12915104-Prorocentrum_lima.AAC.1